MIKDILKLLKVKHYIKNIVVFIPLIFSLNVKDLHLTLLALIAFMAFCLMASAIYVFNDIIDIEQDKLHPIKKTRLIASGQLSIKSAWLIFLVLSGLSCLIAYQLGLNAVLIILSYLFLNILYSYRLKQIPIIDVVCIALGFILRVLIGCVAISVIPSPLVILLTFFTSMFFTFAKRKLEYNLMDKINARKSIQAYNEPLLNQYVTMNAILAIAFYFTYMLDIKTIQSAGTAFLYITVIPFAVIIFRLLFLIYTCTNNDDPAEFIYKDKTIRFLLIIYCLSLFIVLV